ncbi:anthrax toxin lethal factor-related metalloendopeptidase [Oribacterium sp. WCC10]|uniref:anthrax toxin lethal factor-related metalloendopeptidase n=1 Tax=Oribacterium sp. WCC10 TaxID=1855343 RepID=UPI0008E233D5|nr:hypothetical protein [Oribacterium sp. WCC10]SFG42738.1 hypothetical protein SAMN05216356_10876 [Oribacterium sp. WCC10]
MHILDSNDIKKIVLTVTATLFTTLAGGLTSYAAIPLEDSGTAVTSQQIQAVTYQYNMIPASIRDVYEKSGNIIYFFDNNPLIEDLLGAYSGQEGQEAKIILTNRDYGGAEAITHEMGHYFDDICFPDEGTTAKSVVYRGIKFIITQNGKKYISDTDEFKRIFLAEKKNSPVSSYEKTDANEYFAGSFGLYCTSPSSLMKYAPYTYAYIDTLVQQFTQNFPASAENIALTVTVPATIDQITGGTTVSGILISNIYQNAAATSPTSGTSGTQLTGNVSQISGVTSGGVQYTGYTNANVDSEDGVEKTGQTVEAATAAAANGDGTTTVVNTDGSVTTTTVKTTEYGTMVSVVTTYSYGY